MAETHAGDSGCELSPETAGKMLASPDLAALAEKFEVGEELFERAVDIRWLKRRVEYVLAILSAAAGLFPEAFGNCRPTLASFRPVLGDGPVLVRLRAIAGSKIREIPGPVGLNPRFSVPRDRVRIPP